jgi:hypothetical protein
MVAEVHQPESRTSFLENTVKNSSYVLVISDTNTYPVIAVGLRLGRAPDCGIVLSDNAVAWHHALVCETNGAVSVINENSTNGVFVNEYRHQRRQRPAQQRLSGIGLIVREEVRL